ncbi:hypothetical protein ACK3TF_004654 [Chlorella vulgaris]
MPLVAIASRCCACCGSMPVSRYAAAAAQTPCLLLQFLRRLMSASDQPDQPGVPEGDSAMADPRDQRISDLEAKVEALEAAKEAAEAKDVLAQLIRLFNTWFKSGKTFSETNLITDVAKLVYHPYSNFHAIRAEVQEFFRDTLGLYDSTLEQVDGVLPESD